MTDETDPTHIHPAISERIDRVIGDQLAAEVAEGVKNSPVQVQSLTAFGVPLSSRFGQPHEIAEMLEFAALAAERGVIDYIEKVDYQSECPICIVGLREDTPEEAVARIMATGYLALSVFNIHERVGDYFTSVRCGFEKAGADHGRARQAARKLLVRVAKAGGAAAVGADDFAALIAIADDDDGERWRYEKEDAETRERIKIALARCPHCRRPGRVLRVNSEPWEWGVCDEHRVKWRVMDMAVLPQEIAFDLSSWQANAESVAPYDAVEAYVPSAAV